MNYYSIWPDFFSIWHLEKGHVQKECGLDTCWWFRNSANQLRLVVHPIFYRVLYSIILFTSQCRNHKKTEVNHTENRSTETFTRSFWQRIPTPPKLPTSCVLLRGYPGWFFSPSHPDMCLFQGCLMMFARKNGAPDYQRVILNVIK